MATVQVQNFVLLQERYKLLSCREGTAFGTNVHVCGPSAMSIYLSYIPTHLLASERLHLQVSRVGRHRKNTERVRVAKTTLPALNSDDGGASFNDVEVQRAAKTEADTVVDLSRGVSHL